MLPELIFWRWNISYSGRVLRGAGLRGEQQSGHAQGIRVNCVEKVAVNVDCSGVARVGGRAEAFREVAGIRWKGAVSTASGRKRIMYEYAECMVPNGSARVNRV